MRFPSASVLIAILLCACTPPPELFSGDLEPAVTQVTTGSGMTAEAARLPVPAPLRFICWWQNVRATAARRHDLS